MEPTQLGEALVALGATIDDYREWFGALEVGVVVQSNEGVILASNVSASRILDLTPDEIAGRTSHDPRWHAVRADGTPFPGEDHPSMVALRSGEPVRNVVMGLMYPDAPVRWIQINAHPIFEADQETVHAAITTFVDVTDERIASQNAVLRSDLETTSFDSIRLLLGLRDGALAAGIEAVLGAVSEVISADRAYIVRSEVPGADLHCTHEWCAPGVSAFHRRRAVLQGDRYARLVAWASEFEIVTLPTSDSWPEGDDDQHALMRERGMEQLMFFPMKSSLGVIGFLGFERRHLRPWPDGIRSTLRAFVDAVTILEELARSEDRRRAEQARFELLAEENPVGIIEVDLNGLIRYANPAYARMIGRTSGELIGSDGSALLGLPDKWWSRRKLLQLPAGAVRETSETQLLHADGHIVWVEVSGVSITDADGIVTGVLETAIDISDRRAARLALEQSEERFRALVQHASDIFTVLESDGAWRYSSPAGTALLGWLAGSEPPGGILSLVHPDDASFAAEAFGEVVAGTRGPERPVIFRVREYNGNYRVFETVGRNLLDDPAVHGILLISRDITAREEVREQLTCARDAAVAALQARSEFIAIVSHELRTPMHAVLGLSELLANSDLDPAQRQYVESVRRSVQSLSAVVDDILDYSRGEAGRLALHPTTFNLASIVGDVITLFGRSAAEKGLALDSEIDDTVPFLAHGDPDRIRQILVNLVSNAIKYTDAGSVRIRVHATPSEGDNLLVTFSVRDTGFGIDPELQARLFEPFVQGEAATQRRYGGTGLGLAVCRQLVELMHGTLSVTSVPGAGSEFVASVSLQSADRPRMTVRVTMPSPSVARERQVLVVEDNEVNQLLVDRQLAELGIQGVVVGDGPAALASFSQRPWDVVLLDVQLPGMDGLEVARRIRASESAGEHTPIIAMTASAMAGDREACLAAGMDDYLAKPVSLDALRAMLARSLPELASSPTRLPGRAPSTLDALTAELGGDRNTVKRMARTFLDELPQRRSAILSAVDTDALVSAAHGLGSAASALSLTGLFTACRAAEQAASRGHRFDRSTHEAAIERAIQRSQAQLQRWLESAR